MAAIPSTSISHSGRQTGPCTIMHRQIRKSLAETSAHRQIIAAVAQIDDEMDQVGEVCFAVGEQRVDIFERAIELQLARRRDGRPSLAVDARGAGNEDVRAVAVGDAGRALEGDAVVLGRAEVVEIVEIGDCPCARPSTE